jgi:hypothetical protein
VQRRSLQPIDPALDRNESLILGLQRTSVLIASLNLRNRFVATGHFLTMQSRYTLAPPSKYPFLKALPVQLPNVQRKVAILTLKDRTLSPLAELSINTAREVAKVLAKGRET